MKKLLFAALAASVLIFAACNKEIAYNSNSGGDGSRDSASNLKLDQVTQGDVSAPDGDNEDWYYFMLPGDGTITPRIHWDRAYDLHGDMVLYDGYGQEIEVMGIVPGVTDYAFKPLEGNGQNRYFVAIKVTDGKGSYGVEVGFEPKPEPEIAPDETIPEETTPEKRVPRPKCVPAAECKSGQNCCKESGHSEPQPVSTDPIAKGTVVLVTQRGDDLCDIKISGIGTKNNIQPGMKAEVRGLKRSVDLYKCLPTSCLATVKATPDELKRYDTIDVYAN